MKPKFIIKSDPELESRLPFLKFIDEVIITSNMGDTVEVVDIQDGIEFRIEKKYLQLS